MICNRNEISTKNRVSTNGKLFFTISQDMQGFCVLHVYGNSTLGTTNVPSDMWIFFVEKSHCPSDFSLSLNKNHLIPPHNVTLTVTAKPGSLAVIRAIDERLNHIVDYVQAPKPKIYWNLEVFMDPSIEVDAPRLINFLDYAKVNAEIS